MIKAHKIRLNPTIEQETQLWQAAHNARFTFNWGLARWNEIYEAGSKPTINFIKKELTALKRKDFPWLLDSSKSVVEYALMDLKTAYKNFFDGTAQRPHFKSRHRATPAFGLANDRVRLDDHNLKIGKVKGWINMTEALRFEGKLMSVRFSFKAGWWWASFSVDVADEGLVSDGPSVGLDLGIKSLIVTSDGEVIENQGNLRKHLKKLRKAQKSLSRRIKGSNRWYKAKAKVGRLYYKISSLRNDHLHKVTTGLVKTYGFIGIEDLNVKGMVKNHKLALSLSDAALGELRRQLEYKTKWAGVELQKIDRWFPSSKLCHACGHKNDDLTLADRKWVCPGCGKVVDRDFNAALNIRDEALRLAGV